MPNMERWTHEKETDTWWYKIAADKDLRIRGELRPCGNCSVRFPAIKSAKTRYCCHKCLRAAKPLGLGPTHPAWKGGRRIHRGYAVLYITGRGSVREHRFVMEQKLGRPLTSTETVHHINGDKLDNRIENLQLHSRSHGPHKKMRCLNCGSHQLVFVPLSTSTR